MIKEEEIVVTPEMIKAGIEQLFPLEFLPFQDEDEVMGRVFVAMLRLYER